MSTTKTERFNTCKITICDNSDVIISDLDNKIVTVLTSHQWSELAAFVADKMNHGKE